MGIMKELGSISLNRESMDDDIHGLAWKAQTVQGWPKSLPNCCVV